MAFPRSSRFGNRTLWLLAFAVTAATLMYQRTVGPTTPVMGRVRIDSDSFRYRLMRSHGGDQDAPVRIGPVAESVSGVLVSRRYKTGEPWAVQPMHRDGRYLTGTLPHQPPAGKVEYRIYLQSPGSQTQTDGAPGMTNELASAVPAGSVPVPASGPIVLRFRGGVPFAVIFPHALLMFLGMLWSTRTGIEALRTNGRPRKFALWTLGFLVVGGLMLGPLVQWYSFGQAWTGFPFGFDLTDNKTLIAVVFWVLGVIAVQSGRRRATADLPSFRRVLVMLAAVITLVIFSIPHSVIGSELDYSKQKITIVK